MTRLLYHDDGTALQFSGVVSALQGQEAALDATAFYPESGGQSDDWGTLHWAGGEARVVGTHKDKASGVIWHRLLGDLPPVGETVSGQIDAARRWRHMQRHSAEHLLAQAFVRVNPAFVVAAVSMLSAECHLDLLGDPGPDDIAAAETLLREALGREQLVLETPTVPETELGQYPLRRESKVRGQVRLVIFRGAEGQPFDVSACGGTHVPRAAMCAPVVVLRTERIKGGLTRVTFVAGEEASEYLSGVYQSARRMGQRLSVPVERLSERLDAQLALEERQREEIAVLRTRVAQELLRSVTPQAVQGVPTRFVQVDDANLLAPLFSAVQAGEMVVALGPGGRCGVASASGLDASALLRNVLAQTGGKGGGKPELAQGSTQQPEAFMKLFIHS